MSNTSNESVFFEQDDQNNFNLKEVLYKYLSYWRWFVISFFVSVLCAFIYLNYQRPIYQVQSSILIKDEKKGLGQDAMLKELNIFSSNKVVDNEIEILKSYTLMNKVVMGLNLHMTHFATIGFSDVELYGESPINFEIKNIRKLAYEEPIKIKIVKNNGVEINEKFVPFNKVVNTVYGEVKITATGKSPQIESLEIQVQEIDLVVESYMRDLNVEVSSKMSSVLMLSIEVSNRQKGKDIINRLINEYNNAGLQDKNLVAANTLRFIEERLKLISGDLASVEKNVENFKSREGITDISAESKLFLESVQENDKQLNEVKIQQGVLSNIEQYLRKKENNSGTVPATLGISDPTLLRLIQSLSELESKRIQSLKVIKSDNPLIAALDDQIKSIKISLMDNIQTLQKSLSITLSQIEKQNQQMESMIKTVPGKERTLVDITRQQLIKNNLYIFLLQKREETALSYASAVSDSRIIDMARSSTKPVKPIKSNIYILFSMLGLAFPFGIIYVADLLNDKVKSRREIEKVTKAPILSEIFYADHNEALIVSALGKTVMAEQIRTLRTNLSFLAPGKNLQSILFTSSMSGEGKSFISLNLGASLAMTGMKTIILEFDMRKPKLHSALGLKNSKGLSSYLIGRDILKDIITPVPQQENYFIITCGPIPPNPSELLITNSFKELFAELRKQFDYIIIDAPPIGLVTDAQILESQADATLYVLRHDYTPKERLKMINNLYSEKKFKNLNLVFNAIKEGAKYGYGYGYGYGYVENDDNQKGFFQRLFSKKKGIVKS